MRARIRVCGFVFLVPFQLFPPRNLGSCHVSVWLAPRGRYWSQRVGTALVCIALGNAFGQAQPPLQKPSESPRLRPEHLRLAFLVGQWEEEITYPGRAETAEKGHGRWVARPQLGHYLVIRYQGRGPEGNYNAMGVLTWDPAAQVYRMWWFDDAGGVGEYQGSFRDENNLALEHRGRMEGREFRERITYTRVSPSEVRTKIEQAYGDEPYKTYLEAMAHRAEPAGREPGGLPPH